jgi:predicted CoA-binding protein
MTKSEMLAHKKWAVVGDVLNTAKYAYRILEKLKSLDYEVHGVHPRGGQGVYTSLKELPAPPDIMCLVINPALGMEFVRQAQEAGVKGVWIQPGADADEIIEYCRELGLCYLQACVLVETSKG